MLCAFLVVSFQEDYSKKINNKKPCLGKHSQNEQRYRSAVTEGGDFCSFTMKGFDVSLWNRGVLGAGLVQIADNSS